MGTQTVPLPREGRVAISVRPLTQIKHIRAIWKRKLTSEEDMANNRENNTSIPKKGTVTTTNNATIKALYQKS